MNMMAAPPLAIRRYPHNGDHRVSALPLVLLHGWGNDSRVWEAVVPGLRRHFDVQTVDLPGFGDSPPCRTWQEALDGLVRTLPGRAIVAGWSLGGMLAARYAATHPQRVERLITVATNACFATAESWDAAMDRDTFRAFRGQFADAPERALRQFIGLQARGDDSERQVMRWLREQQTEPGAGWLTALDWLGEIDNRESLARLPVRSLHLLGEKDQLVPAAAALELKALIPGSQVRVLPGAGHAPQISRPGDLVDAMVDYLREEQRFALDKARVAHSFGRAAASYDGAADLQREAGEQLLALLPEKANPVAIADMGCGTGHFIRRLARCYPDALSTGVDLAPGMVAHAAARGPEGAHWLCADAEALPLADNRFDLVFSNFTFQWCQNLPLLMAEQFRVLRPGGWLAFTTVGPGSLEELRRAWAAADDRVHVNRFAPLETVREAVQRTGFQILTWDVNTRVRHYRQLTDLTRELKQLGAGNANGGRHAGLTGRRRLVRFREAYEAQRESEGLPATWEIPFVLARKP